jgi:osmoprotectant transport system ATP-binding protein
VADFVGADRGVRRLAVMSIAADDLFQPARVTPGTSMAEARAAAAGVDSPRVLVVDDGGHLHGWIDLTPGLEGLVDDRLVPFELQVPVGSSLRSALGEMLQHDLAWVPVVDGDRFLGVLTPDRLHAAMRRSVGGHPVEA